MCAHNVCMLNFKNTSMPVCVFIILNVVMESGSLKELPPRHCQEFPSLCHQLTLYHGASHDALMHCNHSCVCLPFLCCCSVPKLYLTLCNLMDRGIPCPSPSPGACLNSCPLSHWVIQPSHPCHPLHILHSIIPSIRVFSNELALYMYYLFKSFLVSGSMPCNWHAACHLIPRTVQTFNMPFTEEYDQKTR